MKSLIRPAVSLPPVYPNYRCALSNGRYRHRPSRFPEAASGSQIVIDGRAVGSRLIWQNFTNPKYFWGRAIGDLAAALQRFEFRRLQSGAAQPGADRCRQGQDCGAEGAPDPQHRTIPADLAGRFRPAVLTRIISSGCRRVPDRACSQSPPDRHCQALRPYQERPKKANGVIFGNPRVNVLKLNLALDSKF